MKDNFTKSYLKLISEWSKPLEPAKPKTKKIIKEQTDDYGYTDWIEIPGERGTVFEGYAFELKFKVWPELEVVEWDREGNAKKMSYSSDSLYNWELDEIGDVFKIDEELYDKIEKKEFDLKKKSLEDFFSEFLPNGEKNEFVNFEVFCEKIGKEPAELLEEFNKAIENSEFINEDLLTDHIDWDTVGPVEPDYVYGED